MILSELINALGGSLVQGSPETVVAGVADSGSATGQHLVFAEDAPSAAKAVAGAAGAVVLKAGCLEGLGFSSTMAVVEADQPRLWFARAARLLKPPPRKPLLKQPHHIGINARLGRGVYVGAGAIVGAFAVIGDGTRIEAGAIIGEGVNVDFPVWMIESLDREAKRLGVTRQSIIKVWIADRLEKKAS